MRTLSAFRLSLLAMMFVPAVYGTGVLVAPCGAPQTFIGNVSTTIHCSIGTAADNAIGGASAVAGLDNFENHLSPIHFYGDTDAFTGTGTWTVTSNPTWDAGVISVP